MMERFFRDVDFQRGGACHPFCATVPPASVMMSADFSLPAREYCSMAFWVQLEMEA